jgi:hypothetical protein
MTTPEALLAVLGAAFVAWAGYTYAAVRRGSKADEAALRQRGCTCQYPRAGDHEGSCPLYRDDTDQGAA